MLRKWSVEAAKNYLESQGILEDLQKLNQGSNKVIKADFVDLARIHNLVRNQASRTVLEFGSGFSTWMIADALAKNEEDERSLGLFPEERNRFRFQCFSVETDERWRLTTLERLPRQLCTRVTISITGASIGTFRDKLCHYYDNLPDIVPDFIYLDGPDPEAVTGTLSGATFESCQERTVMAADLLKIENTMLPGTTILVDGRTNNARFLARNFDRQFTIEHDTEGDVTLFQLVEDRLGRLNHLGIDSPYCTRK
jgi:hypothetical protein